MLTMFTQLLNLTFLRPLWLVLELAYGSLLLAFWLTLMIPWTLFLVAYMPWGVTRHVGRE